MVERSVARSAQEELLARGISLVQHTKPELLERLGRCMGVKVSRFCCTSHATAVSPYNGSTSGRTLPASWRAGHHTR